MEPWVGTLLGGVFGGGGLAAVLVFIATRKRDNAAGIAERFDDASELSKYIDERVEAKVKPIRDQLGKVTRDSQEIQDAFRAWVSAVWVWHQRGRFGDLPMPPAQILSRIGLGHFADDWPTEPPRTKPKP
jgi:hypothetical protein